MVNTARWLEHRMELDFQLRGFAATFQDSKGNLIHSYPRMFINIEICWKETLLTNHHFGESAFTVRITNNATSMPTNNPVYQRRDQRNSGLMLECSWWKPKNPELLTMGGPALPCVAAGFQHIGESGSLRWCFAGSSPWWWSTPQYFEQK